MSLQFSAPAGVKSAGHKKQRDDGDENKVNHRFCFQIASLGGAADAATKLFGLRREAKRHAAFTAWVGVPKRCRRCALPPHSKILAAFRALIRQSGLLRVGQPRSGVKLRSFISAQ